MRIIEKNKLQKYVDISILNYRKQEDAINDDMELLFELVSPTISLDNADIIFEARDFFENIYDMNPMTAEVKYCDRHLYEIEYKIDDYNYVTLISTEKGMIIDGQSLTNCTNKCLDPFFAVVKQKEGSWVCEYDEENKFQKVHRR